MEKQKIVVVVSGGRDNTAKQPVYTALDDLAAQYQVVAVYEGGARGVDQSGARWRIKTPGVLGTSIPPNREAKKQFGHAAALLMRNHTVLIRAYRHIIEGAADQLRVLIFPGESGTAHMSEISQAFAKRNPHVIVQYVSAT